MHTWQNIIQFWFSCTKTSPFSLSGSFLNGCVSGWKKTDEATHNVIIMAILNAQNLMTCHNVIKCMSQQHKNYLPITKVVMWLAGCYFIGLKSKKFFGTVITGTYVCAIIHNYAVIMQFSPTKIGKVTLCYIMLLAKGFYVISSNILLYYCQV